MVYIIDPSKWRETNMPTHRDTGMWTHFRVAIWSHEGFETVLNHGTLRSKAVDMWPGIRKSEFWNVMAEIHQWNIGGRVSFVMHPHTNGVPFAPANHVALYWPFGVQHWVPIPPQVDRLQALSFDEAVMGREAPLEAYADWLCEQGWDERWKLATKELERAGRQADSFDA